MSSKRFAVDEEATSGVPKRCRSEIGLLSVVDFVFVSGLFALNDLQALMNVSKTASDLIRRSRAWKQQYLVDKVITHKFGGDHSLISRINPLGLAPPYGSICKDYWKGPHIPSDGSADDLHIPPRPRARTSERPDHNSYYPHRKDKKAIGYVLAERSMSFPPGIHRFNPETGALEDLFYPAGEDAGSRFGIVVHRTKVYIQRDLPVVCNACGGVSCNTYSDLVEHCLTVEHQIAMTPRERRIPKEFWDPRNRPSFANMSPFEQVRACLTYKHKILDFLRAPMDDAGVRNMCRQLGWIRESAEENGYSTENCTLEGVTKACIDFVVGDFDTDGLNLHGYCRDVLIGGWGNFEMHGSGSADGLFSMVVGC